MNDINPITILLMFGGRCLAPLLLMLGVSYILRRLGLIKEPPPPPDTMLQPEPNHNHIPSGGVAHD